MACQSRWDYLENVGMGSICRKARCKSLRLLNRGSAPLLIAGVDLNDSGDVVAAVLRHRVPLLDEPYFCTVLRWNVAERGDSPVLDVIAA